MQNLMFSYIEILLTCYRYVKLFRYAISLQFNMLKSRYPGGKVFPYTRKHNIQE